MKIFSNKRYQKELEKVKKPLENRILELRSKIDNKEYNFLEENSKLHKELTEYEEIIKSQDDYLIRLNNENKLLKEEIRKINGAKGGLTKYAHRLEKELAEANEKLSQRYILKELVAEKPKNMQVMKTKSSAKTSRIIRKVVNDD